MSKTPVHVCSTFQSVVIAACDLEINREASETAQGTRYDQFANIWRRRLLVPETDSCDNCYEDGETVAMWVSVSLGYGGALCRRCDAMMMTASSNEDYPKGVPYGR